MGLVSLAFLGESNSKIQKLCILSGNEAQYSGITLKQRTATDRHDNNTIIIRSTLISKRHQLSRWSQYVLQRIGNVVSPFPVMVLSRPLGHISVLVTFVTFVSPKSQVTPLPPTAFPAGLPWKTTIMIDYETAKSQIRPLHSHE